MVERASPRAFEKDSPVPKEEIIVPARLGQRQEEAAPVVDRFLPHYSADQVPIQHIVVVPTRVGSRPVKQQVFALPPRPQRERPVPEITQFETQ